MKNNSKNLQKFLWNPTDLLKPNSSFSNINKVYLKIYNRLSALGMFFPPFLI